MDHHRWLIALLASTCCQAASLSDITILPQRHPYPSYDADPRRPQMSLAHLYAVDSELDDRFAVGDTRFGINLGMRAPLLSWQAAADQSIGLAISGGFFGQFDQERSLDGIGWDGLYAIALAWRHGPWHAQLQLHHISSHRADEFILRTGTDRYGYTREALQPGVAVQLPYASTVYIEPSYAVHLSDDEQERWALHYGVNHRRLLGGHAYSLGLDVQHFEENDWQADLTLRAGYHILSSQASDREINLALEFRDGRSALGEFSYLDEQTLALVFEIRR
ncbi:MAG: DUF1207 domain-containing protein [Planctomycetota bacterium]